MVIVGWLQLYGLLIFWPKIFNDTYITPFPFYTFARNVKRRQEKKITPSQPHHLHAKNKQKNRLACCSNGHVHFATSRELCFAHLYVRHHKSKGYGIRRLRLAAFFSNVEKSLRNILQSQQQTKKSKNTNTNTNTQTQAYATWKKKSKSLLRFNKPFMYTSLVYLVNGNYLCTLTVFSSKLGFWYMLTI